LVNSKYRKFLANLGKNKSPAARKNSLQQENIIPCAENYIFHSRGFKFPSVEIIFRKHGIEKGCLLLGRWLFGRPAFSFVSLL
jgi:hypothetical protein